VVLQGNAIVGNLNTTLVVDVSSLTDTLQTSPPVNVQPQSPVSPITPASPIEAPRSEITFAPIPGPVEFPPSFRAPILLSPNSSDTPSVAPTSVGTTAMPTVPKRSPSSANGNDDPSRSAVDDGGGLDWWSWLLIGGGVLAVLVCGYTVVQTRTGSDATNPPSRRRRREANFNKSDAPDTEDDEPLYEPPPTITSYIAPSDNRFSTVTSTAPVVIPSLPDTTVTAEPAFVLDAQDDYEEEEEEDYTEEEEEEDLEADEDVHHHEGEVFEDEESYYEEEEEDDVDFVGGNPSVA
jgi:hypothetical protein